MLENDINTKELLQIFNERELYKNWKYNKTKGNFIKKKDYISAESFSKKYITQSDISTEESFIVNKNVDEKKFDELLNDLSKYEIVKTIKISRDKITVKQLC